MKWIRFFIFLIASSVAASFLNQSQSNIFVNKNLIAAVNQIIQKIFAPKYSTVNIIYAVEDNSRHYSQLIVSEICIRSEGKAVFSLKDYKNLEEIQSSTTQNFEINQSSAIQASVVLLDSIVSFRKFNKKVKSKVFMFGGHFLFVLVKGKQPEHAEIFSTLWAKFIGNVDFIYDDGKIDTFLPFKKNSPCGDTNPVSINSYENGEFENGIEAVFPEKLKNLQNCSIRFVTFEDTFSVKKINNSDGYELSGYDIEMMTALANSLNFYVQLTFLNPVPVPWGMVYPNGTVTNALGEIYHNRADVVIGNFFLEKNRLKVFDSSITYHSFTLVFVIPPGEYFNAYEKLLQPFESMIWLLFIIFMTSGLLVMLFFNVIFKKLNIFVSGEGISHSMLNMAILIFGGTIHKLPSETSARLLLTAFLIFCLVLRTGYLGALFIFLQSNGRMKEVESFDEMVQKGFDIFMYQSYSDFVDLHEKMRDRFHLKGDNGFLEKPLEPSQKIAYIVSSLDLAWYNHLYADQFAHKTCAENLVMQNLVLYFRKNFFLVKSINEKINIFLQSGLASFWIKKHVANQAFQNMKHGPESLSLRHLSGIFHIYLIFSSLAFLVFLLEIGAYRIKKSSMTEAHASFELETRPRKWSFFGRSTSSKI